MTEGEEGRVVAVVGGVGEEGGFLTLHCQYQKDFCIYKTGSDDSYFNCCLFCS